MTVRLPRALALLVPLLAGLATILLLRRESVEPGGDAVPEDGPVPATAPVEAAGSGDAALATSGGRRASSRSEGGRPGAAPAGDPETAAVAEAVDPKGPFRGICVDEDGRPVPGAAVQVVGGRAGPRGGVDRGAFAEARAGADGRFEIAAAPAVESIRVRAAARDRVAARADEEIARGTLARIVLLRVVEVRVRVIEREGGGAVRGARVALLAGVENAHRGDVDFAIHPPTDDVSTDDTGRAVLRAPGGPCAVLVKAPKRSPRLVGPLHAPAAGLDLTVVLERGGAVGGRVLGEDGRPVGGARVLARARLGWIDQATTEADGTFRLEGMPEPPPPPAQDVAILDPTLVAVVEAQGYPLHAFETTLEDAAESLPAAGGWELRLSRAGPVTGTVTAVAPPFPPGSTLRLVPSIPIPDGIAMPTLPAPVPVAPDGSFRFDDVGVLPVEVLVEDPAGRGLSANHSVIGPRVGGGSRSTRSIFPREPRRDLELRPLRLRVVDEEGRGAAGVALEVGFGDGRVLHLTARGVTDTEGRAVVDALRSVGTPCVVVHPPGRPAFSAAVAPEADASVEVTIPVPIGREPGRVRRLDAKAAPPGLWLATRLGRVGAPETTVGRLPVAVSEAGAFVLEGLGEDTHVLAADEPFVLVQPPSVSPGETLDLLAVTPAEAVSLQVAVRLEPPAGEEIRWASMSLTDPAGEEYAVYLRATGEPGVWLSDPPVPPGVYTATVEVPDYRPVTVPSVRIDGGDRSPRITVPLSR